VNAACRARSAEGHFGTNRAIASNGKSWDERSSNCRPNRAAISFPWRFAARGYGVAFATPSAGRELKNPEIFQAEIFV